MGNQQTSSGKKKRSSVLPSSSAVMSAIEVTEHNHFHAGGDGEGNPFEKYIYPFENLVFEGAGNRLLAYCGAVRVLEEAGIWSQIKRLAGSNTGAIMAALLGVGYKSHDIQQFFSKSVQSIFEDHNLGCCGCCSLLSRLRNEYGCSSGKKLKKWIGKKMENATGTANITFQQVYDRFGKEICIAVTNVNQQITEYCHVKTTPSMPVRVAVCMSLAIPGVFQPVKYKRYSHVDHYVDGGLLCNHPIDCFDGWWLSMEKNDSFLKKLQPLSDLPRLMDKRSRFATYNEKTMGFVLFSEKEPDAMQTILEDREGKILSSDDPSTKLSRNVIPRIIARREAANQHDQFVMSSRRFLQVLDESSLSQMEAISIKDLQKALQKKTDLSSTDLEQIFGLTTTLEDIFRILNKSDKQWVTYNKLVKFLEEKSTKLYSSFLQENSRDTLDLASYVRSIRDSFHTNTRRHFVEKRDLERTVGINTYYVGSRDFKLEKGDIDMLLEQGRRATLSYLLYFVTHRHAPLKTKDPRLSFCPDDSLPFYIDDEVPSEIIDENDYAEQFLVVPHS